MAGGSASALSLSRPARASLTLRPAGSLNRLMAAFVARLHPSGYPTKPLASYQINRQLSGWNLPPLVIRAFGAHCQHATSRCYSIASPACAARTRRQLIYAKNLPRNSPASCLRGIADDLRQQMRQNKNASSSRRSYCRKIGRLSGPRKPNPCQRTPAGSGKVMLGKRSNSMGSRIAPTVRRDRCAPAQ